MILHDMKLKFWKLGPVINKTYKFIYPEMKGKAITTNNCNLTHLDKSCKTSSLSNHKGYTKNWLVCHQMAAVHPWQMLVQKNMFLFGHVCRQFKICTTILYKQQEKQYLSLSFPIQLLFWPNLTISNYRSFPWRQCSFPKPG